MLYNPLIPHNTGNIIRLCANIGARLHLIKPLGFSLENKDLKRAALDYSDLSIVQMYSSLDEYVKTHDINRIFATMPSAHNLYSEIRYKIGDTLLFGPEDTGLPKEVEKLIPNPRHIEVQVFADRHGNVVHMFERDCSIQRRHQKVIEESPGPSVNNVLREEILEAAVKATKAIDYLGAGTGE